MMLKLRDFLHLPQMDALIERLIQDEPGLVILAGIDARPAAAQAPDSFRASGLSALFNILMQEILLAHPQAQAVVVAEGRTLARVPRQLTRRVRSLLVEPPASYPQQIDLAAKQRPGLLVIDHLSESALPAAFRAAKSGLRVLAQMDTVMRGAAVVRQLVEMGASQGNLGGLRWILTNQRMSLLCETCKLPVEDPQEAIGRLLGRYPHLAEPVVTAQASGARFFRAGGCERCKGTGYNGDIAVFDLFRNEAAAEQPYDQPSLLSMEEYALHLAIQGQLDLTDLIDLENDHLRRTYQMLTTSERALAESNAALTRKLFELEASNRVLVQRTEVLVSLQDLGQALISTTSLGELAARVCRRASDLCGADRVALYLRREAEDGAITAELLAERGWGAPTGQSLEAARVFGEDAERLAADGVLQARRSMQPPPGFRLDAGPAQGGGGGNAAATPPKIRMGLRAPLVAQDRLVGVMVVQSTQKDHFTPGEVSLLQAIANQAALAIQRAGLEEALRAKISQLEEAQAELVQKERLERELELAREVQQSMLPHSFPQVPGYTLAAMNEPARQVGGDFYDVFVLDEDHFGVVVADVADKGLPAALYMALTRSLLLAEARRTLSPREALVSVNRLLLEFAELSGFVSVFYGVVEGSTRRITYARAGHERPLLLRGGEITALEGSGTVLGVLESEQLNLSEEHAALSPGDRLALYTDGLSDVLDPAGKFAGLERFKSLLAPLGARPVDVVCAEIFTALTAYRGLAEQFDDMTLLVLAVDR